MKDYTPEIIRCRCSNLMRLGKRVKITQFTPKRKRGPNCGKMLRIFVEKK